jgi:hypothetical protein
MGLSLDSVTSGPPAKFSYTDSETGDKRVSDVPLDEDGNVVVEASDNQSAQNNSENAALGADQEEAKQVVTIGNTGTVFEDPSGTDSKEPDGIYGNSALKSRAYEVDEATIPGVDSVRSKANPWVLINYRNYAGGTAYSSPKYKDYNKTVIQNNKDNILNPTAKRIVEYSNTNGGLGFAYSYRDFIQAEYYGQISNEYLITLRRFAFPVGDDIMNTKGVDDKGKEFDRSEPDIARAVTWLSPALENNLTEILSFGTGFGWQDIESKVQEASTADQSQRRGTLGALIESSPAAKAVESGVNGYSAAQADRINTKGHGFDPLGQTYPNFVYGPYNAIKQVKARDEKGLKFDNKFTLNFCYDLRGFDNTSPKVVFMDVLSNLLAITYNNAPFWGGATRYTGTGSTGKPFGDFDKLKNGDYAGYLGSVATQLKSSVTAGFNDIGKAVTGLVNGKGVNALGDSKILDNLIGGNLMKLMGSPAGGDVIQAFLTGDPTGQWHLTVGNPMNPMLVCGNLCLINAAFKFEGPIGYEGFPSKLKMTVELEPGRPRDKSEIESMFNAGRGRFYLQPEVEGKSLDDVLDISQYGNKDRARLTGDRALRNSDYAAG